MRTLEKPRTLLSTEQMSISFGQKVLAMRDEYRQRTKEIFEEVSRHEYVEGLYALCEEFAGTMEMKAKEHEKGIEDIAKFVEKMAWCNGSIDQDLLRLSQKDLERVRREADQQRYRCYEEHKQEMSIFKKLKYILAHHGDGFCYGDMFDDGGSSQSHFHRLHVVACRADEMMRMRELLHTN